MILLDSFAGGSRFPFCAKEKGYHENSIILKQAQICADSGHPSVYRAKYDKMEHMMGNDTDHSNPCKFGPLLANPCNELINHCQFLDCSHSLSLKKITGIGMIRLY